VLFSIYSDILLRSLSTSGFGCYIGNVFCGALAYADDIVLLSPNKSSLSSMLKIASDVATSLRLKFNQEKSQYLVYRSKASTLSFPSRIDFSGVNVVEATEGAHLGNILGASSLSSSISRAVSDLYSRTNVLLSRFGFCSPADVRYRLFKSYCVIAYGSPLWDLDGAVISDYYTAWRKCVRRVWGIPNRTHCDLLPGICDDRGIETQLISRTVKFIRSAMQADNLPLNICIQLALSGSNSSVSNSISFISNLFQIPRNAVPSVSVPVTASSPITSAIRDFVFTHIQ